MADFLVREAVEDDCAGIFETIKGQAVHHSTPFDQLKLTEEALRKDGFGERRFYYCFVAQPTTNGVRDERPLAGHAMYHYSYSAFNGKTMYLEDIYVRPEWRSKGVGSAMWAKVTELALAEDCAFVSWIVYNWNKDSIAYYKRQGGIDLTNDQGQLVYKMDRETMEKFVAKKLKPSS